MIKPIINYQGYFISDDGKVFCNLGKGNRNKNKTVQMYEIKPRPTRHGYLRVCMRNSLTNKRDDKYIHRLVAEYFIPNPNNYKYVNHKDFDRRHNYAENLEWCTAKQNTEYTLNSKHVIRDSKGRYKSNFDYTTYISSKDNGNV